MLATRTNSVPNGLPNHQNGNGNGNGGGDDALRFWMLSSNNFQSAHPTGRPSSYRDLNVSHLTGAPLKQMLGNGGGREPMRRQTSLVANPNHLINNNNNININQQQPQMAISPKNPKLYKTELCRSWMDYGRCNYGDRCQYAHGEHEKRPVPRHPKYKTEYCQSYHHTGYCPYGPRCHFIHNEEPTALLQSSQQPNVPSLAPIGSNQQQQQQQQQQLLVNLNNGAIVPNTVNGSCGSAGESPVPSSADSGSDSPSFSPGLSLDVDDLNCPVPSSGFGWASTWSPVTTPGSINDLAWQFEEKTSLVSGEEPIAPGRLPVFARLSNASSA